MFKSLFFLDYMLQKLHVSFGFFFILTTYLYILNICDILGTVKVSLIIVMSGHL